MDDPVARRRRAEELARQKHPHPRLIGGRDAVFVYAIPSSTNDTVYTIEVNASGNIIRHTPACKQWELFGVCSHAAAAWLDVHERMCERAAIADAEVETGRVLRGQFKNPQVVQLQLFNTERWHP